MYRKWTWMFDFWLDLPDLSSTCIMDRQLKKCLLWSLKNGRRASRKIVQQTNKIVVLRNFCWPQWWTSLPGLRTLDPPLGTSSALAEILRRTNFVSVYQATDTLESGTIVQHWTAYPLLWLWLWLGSPPNIIHLCLVWDFLLNWCYLTPGNLFTKYVLITVFAKM